MNRVASYKGDPIDEEVDCVMDASWLDGRRESGLDAKAMDDRIGAPSRLSARDFGAPSRSVSTHVLAQKYIFFFFYFIPAPFSPYSSCSFLPSVSTTRSLIATSRTSLTTMSRTPIQVDLAPDREQARHRERETLLREIWSWWRSSTSFPLLSLSLVHLSLGPSAKGNR